jgi:ADP-ribose pyrophosphatase YjhB (NUDIX family)
MIGVNIAIFQGKQLLLTQREDFEVWCLPGGKVEPGETLAQAAVREAKEATELEVGQDRLVGLYSEPRLFYRGLHVAVFTGQMVGGELKPQLEEVIEARFFGPDELPDDFQYGNRQRVLDALAGKGGGASWTQSLPGPFDLALDRGQIYELRDCSGLSRSAFYRQHFRSPAQGDEVDELSAVNF